MKLNSFIAQLGDQLVKNLPFVAFRHPGERLLNALFQQTDELLDKFDFTEAGFVFAPFDKVSSGVFFPYAEENFLSIPYEESDFSSSGYISSDSEESERAQYLKLVSMAIDKIKNSGLEKVVLSRNISIENRNLSPIEIFQNLLALYSEAFVYIWFHPKVGLWMGATPEQLVKIDGNNLTTVSLAGTKSREDQVWTQKEYEEQQYVTDFIENALKGEVDHLHIGQVETINSGSVFHLKSKISGRIDKGVFNVKSLIDKLHPTPAVCGAPRDIALEFILNNEQYSRKFYTGYLGTVNWPTRKLRRQQRNIENQAYFQQRTNTDLYVNLRCLKYTAAETQIFVGGGITADSNEEDEWAETEQKAKTILAAIPSE